VLSEYKKEKGRIEKFADQWCRDNNYLIRRSNYKKSQNMSRPYKGTWWGRNKKAISHPRAIDGYGE
jgi:hypothetical protein